MTHDGGVKVLNSLDYFHGKRMSNYGPVEIGNNVYIGYGAMVMPNTKIGDNVIIGAGAVVTRNIKSNSVAVGVPAKVIKSIDEYYGSTLLSVVETSQLSSEEKQKFIKQKFNMDN